MATVIEEPKKRGSKRPVPVGTAIDTLWGLREQKRAMKAALDQVDEEIRAQEAIVLERLDQEGLDKSTGKAATASVSKVESVNLVDYDAFTTYVKKTGQLHLFERRVSKLAALELFEKHGGVPGCERFTQRKINLRTTNAKE